MLSEEAKKNWQRYPIEYDDWFHMSRANYCLKQHYYSVTPGIEPIFDDNFEGMMKMRLGTIFHKDIENAVKSPEGIEYFLKKGIFPLLEEEVTLKAYCTRGHTDLALISRNDGSITICDQKLIGAYQWRKKFGFKKNREKEPSEKYEYQVATYALGVSQKYNMSEDCIKHLKLFYFNRDTCKCKEISIDISYLQKAKNYWKTVIDTYCDKKMSELIPFTTPMVPVEAWECKYCPYKYVCLENDETKQK